MRLTDAVPRRDGESVRDRMATLKAEVFGKRGRSKPEFPAAASGDHLRQRGLNPGRRRPRASSHGREESSRRRWDDPPRCRPPLLSGARWTKLNSRNWRRCRTGDRRRTVEPNIVQPTVAATPEAVLDNPNLQKIRFASTAARSDAVHPGARTTGHLVDEYSRRESGSWRISRVSRAPEAFDPASKSMRPPPRPSSI